MMLQNKFKEEPRLLPLEVTIFEMKNYFIIWLGSCITNKIGKESELHVKIYQIDMKTDLKVN